MPVDVGDVETEGRFCHLAVAQKTSTTMACPGKWKHGTKPAVCPSDRLILSHTHLLSNKRTLLFVACLCASTKRFLRVRDVCFHVA